MSSVPRGRDMRIAVWAIMIRLPMRRIRVWDAGARALHVSRMRLWTVAMDVCGTAESWGSRPLCAGNVVGLLLLR